MVLAAGTLIAHSRPATTSRLLRFACAVLLVVVGYSLNARRSAGAVKFNHSDAVDVPEPTDAVRGVFALGSSTSTRSLFELDEHGVFLVCGYGWRLASVSGPRG
jgi:hypothetical protein